MLQEHFPAVTAAICDGEFALWVGSGISRLKAPDVGRLITALIEHMRTTCDRSDATDPLLTTLKTILVGSAGLAEAEFTALPLDQPFPTWPQRAAIISALWNKYSALLNLRPAGKDRDYMLWEAVDVRAQYGHLDDPDTKHLCIAILVLEGVIEMIASGNWDGLIEAAVDRLSPSGRMGVLQTIVDPDDVRDPPAPAILVKFHGCAVACVADSIKFRHFLVGAERDITHWPNIDDPMHREVERIATNKRGLFVGLSLQDTNLRNVFSKARTIKPWPWPPTPHAQAQLFCEDQLGPSQELVLEVVYGDAAYDAFTADIKAASLLRARPKTVLPALVLHVLCDKLQELAARGLATVVGADQLGKGIDHLRDIAAAAAPKAASAIGTFVTDAIVHWSRTMMLFRQGEAPPAGSAAYQTISRSRRTEMLADPNVATSGLDQLGVALGLIGRLASMGTVTLAPASGTVAAGTLSIRAAYPSARERLVTFVGTADAALQLMADGAFDDENAIVLHSSRAFTRLIKGGRRNPSGSAIGRGARHVSVRQLVDESLNLVELEERFLEEAAL
jgi:hypothetical protein